MSIDLKNLSKKKYVYYMHVDGVYNVSFERYPVIYVNKKYVYIKKGSDEDLTKLHLYTIKEISDIITVIGCYNFCYLWDNPSDEYIEKIRKEVMMLKHEKNKKEFMQDLDRARVAYERMLEKGMLLGYIER